MYYYQHHIGDYRKDTTHLSILEHGAYRQLLDLYYISEQPLPLDDAKLMRLVCARNADEVQAVKNVLDDFFEKTKDGYIQSRCDKEINAYHGKSLKAKASADARWNKNKDLQDANALRTDCEGNANHKPLTINHKPIINKGSRLSKDWILPKEYLEFCNKERSDLNAEYVAEQFKDYWISVAGSRGIKADWFATWRNWVRKQYSQTLGNKQQKRDEDLQWFLGNQPAIEKDITHG